MIHQVIRQSNSGSTRFVDSIHFEIQNPKTYASYVLLKNYYFELDEYNSRSIANRMRMVRFSRNHLSDIQRKEGSLTCTYCSKPNLVIELHGMKVSHSIKATIDHIVPKSKGGELFNTENIAVCCGKCNSKKSSMSVEEFLKIVKPYVPN